MTGIMISKPCMTCGSMRSCQDLK